MANDKTAQQTVTLDSRKRLSLAKFIQGDAPDGYIVTEESGGKIILEPAVVMTHDEYEERFGVRPS